MPLSPEDQVRYDRLKAQNARIAASIAAPPTPPLYGPGAEPPAYGDAADRAAADQRGKGILAQLPTLDATTAARQTGGTLVDAMPRGVDPGQRVVAHPSTLTGGRMQDGLPQPIYQTDYAVYGNEGRQGALTITGANRRAGGGTLSVLDQGNGGTVAGNVAALDRQTEALRSLREARNPGITTGQAGRAFGDLVSFGTPGGGFGQDALDANRAPALSDQFAGQPGGARARRDLLSLMDLQQRDQHFNAQQQQQAAQQQAGILRGAQEAQNAAANRQWEQAKWGQQYGLDQQKLALDQGKFVLDAASRKPALSPYETTLQQERAKQEIDRAQQNRTGLADLQDTISKINKLYGMADTSGTFNSIMAMVGKPFNTEGAAQAEEFRSISNALVGSLIKSLGANPSNADLKFIQEEVSRMGNTPEGNRRILDNMRQFALQKAMQNGVDIKPMVERRGAALEQAGMPRDQVIETLRKEFAGAY